VAVLIKIEIYDALAEGTETAYNAALEAISFQYNDDNWYCKGSCSSLKEQLEWMDSMHNWRERKDRLLPNPLECIKCMSDAAKAIAGYNDGDGFQAVWWANPYRGSDLANYIQENYPSADYLPYALMVDGNKFIVGFRGREDDPTTPETNEGILDFVVVTGSQNAACYSTTPNCMGFPLP
jgi:hypothetical protein